MINLKNNKGITIYALIITVIVLTIIAGTAVYTGMDVYQDAKKEAFVQELQMIQNAVNNEYSKIELASLKDEDGDGTFDYIYNITWANGQDLPDDLSNEVQQIIGDGNGYRYFEKNDLEEIGIKSINEKVLINFTIRDVVSVNGFDGKYRLSEFSNEMTNYNSNVILTIDDVPIPDGFVYLTGRRENGLVIKNIQDGNEFVWVPVENIESFPKKTSGWTNGTKQGWVGREPDVVTGQYATGTSVSDLEGTSYDGVKENREAILDDGYENTNAGLKQQFTDEYNDMVESVKTYGGFYVGRYETGWDITNKVVISKEGVSPMTANTMLKDSWTKVGNSDNNNRATWYGLYAKQKELYKKNSSFSVVSGMIYGCQWDAIMDWMSDVENPTVEGKKFIEDSTGMGWFKDNVPSDFNYATGKKIIHTDGSVLNRVKNIYDLAGNLYEWTQEINIYKNRVVRGGYTAQTGLAGTVSWRGVWEPTVIYSSNTTRMQLYIKVN